MLIWSTFVENVEHIASSLQTAFAPVLKPFRITLENNGKIRPQPDREKTFAGASGGEGGTLLQLPRKRLRRLSFWLKSGFLSTSLVT